jgi:hypothetical protein
MLISSSKPINVKSFITKLVSKVKAAFALPEPAMGLAYA